MKVKFAFDKEQIQQCGYTVDLSLIHISEPTRRS